jgi:hypothetical protein
MRAVHVRSALSVSLAAVAAAALAQAPADRPDAAVEPGAMTALGSMGAYLRTLRQYQVDAVTTDEKVLDDGQKILTDGTIRILAEMPGRLYAEVQNDRHERTYLYDGKSFTLFARRANLYATIPAPPTIGQLADKLEAEYDFSVPLVDLFRWGGPSFHPEGITGAIDVGPGVVLGTTCEQFAFRQGDVDWQVWLQKGDHPLPRRIVITTRTDEARPQHTATYTWNLAPSFSPETFVFFPPEGAGKVVLAAARRPE